MAKRKRLSPSAPGVPKGAPAPIDAPPGLREPGGSPLRPAPALAPIAGVARDAAGAAALAELSDTLRTARETGRMVVDLPLERVRMDHLVRDRVAADPAEMTALVESLRARGQQTPIEVVTLAGGDYGLISGWRRCQALRILADETGEAAQVLALLRRPREASEAYLAMVEENEIRVGLSYYERARIALKAAEAGVFDSERAALQELFQSASKAKRSKIGSFMAIVRALDGHLRFPAALGERAGLILARALDEDPDLGARLRDRLADTAPATPEAERDFLAAASTPDPGSGSGPGTPSARKVSRAKPDAAARARGRERLRPGLWLTRNPDGTLTLGGVDLDAGMRARLVAWLRADG